MSNNLLHNYSKYCLFFVITFSICHWIEKTPRSVGTKSTFDERYVMRSFYAHDGKEFHVQSGIVPFICGISEEKKKKNQRIILSFFRLFKFWPPKSFNRFTNSNVILQTMMHGLLETNITLHKYLAPQEKCNVSRPTLQSKNTTK